MVTDAANVLHLVCVWLRVVWGDPHIPYPTVAPWQRLPSDTCSSTTETIQAGNCITAYNLALVHSVMWWGDVRHTCGVVFCRQSLSPSISSKLAGVCLVGLQYD